MTNIRLSAGNRDLLEISLETKVLVVPFSFLFLTLLHLAGLALGTPFLMLSINLVDSICPIQHSSKDLPYPAWPPWLAVSTPPKWLQPCHTCGLCGVSHPVLCMSQALGGRELTVRGR